MNFGPPTIDELWDALDAATGGLTGKWFVEDGGVFNETRSYMVCPTGDSEQDRADAALIAMAPDLAREVMRCRAHILDLEGD